MNFGGKYKASENADGTWNLYMVPVLAAHERDLGWDVEGKATKFCVDDAWLEKALAKAVARKTQDNYLAPLHVNHHGRKEEVSRAGYFMPRRVGMIHYQGLELPCMFSDFLSIKPEIYAKVKSGDLPYVSVEILDVTAEPEIDSCSMLDHVVPYFKFPLLNVGEEIPAASVSAVSGAGPMTAYARSGKRLSILCYMAGAEAPEKKDSEAPVKDKDKDGDVDADDAEKEDETSGGLLDKIKQMLEAVMQHLGLSKAGIPDPSPIDQGTKTMEAAKPSITVTASAGNAVTMAVPAVIAAPAPAAAPVAATYSKADLDSAVAVALAGLKGEVDSLKAQMSKQGAEDGIRAKVGATIKRLAAYALGADAEAELFGIAQKAGDQADAVLSAYSAAIEKRGVKDPAPAFTADSTVSQDALPAEVLAYSSPEKVKKATEYWNSFKAMGHHAGTTTLKEFLSNCMSADSSFKPFKPAGK